MPNGIRSLAQLRRKGIGMTDLRTPDKGQEKIVLFHDKADCCACGACASVCARGAIAMQPDEYGFVYPQIDHSLCVKCRECLDVCAFQRKEETNEPLEIFAASSKDDGLVARSSSGGIFGEFAREILSKGGAVFGARINKTEGRFSPALAGVTAREDLGGLLGSKYVHCLTGNAFTEAEEYLKKGRSVLFCAAPCQIAGLTSFLKKDYDQLLTMDFICHGVPPARLFTDYIALLEKKLRAEITGFDFRDKSRGWELNGKVYYRSKTGRQKSVRVPRKTSSYYSLFLESVFLRENCYRCKYACENRPGDLTLGDFWGIRKVHPEYMLGCGGELSDEKGISCVIANTPKGIRVLNELKDGLVLCESTFEKAAQNNPQLRAPSVRSGQRNEALEQYLSRGYQALEERFTQRLGYKIHLLNLFEKLPRKMQTKIKSTLMGSRGP